MEGSVLKRVDAALALTNGLAEGLTAADLDRRIDDVPSNSLGSQFWCVVGARESYHRGILAGSWQGFHCSLTRTQTKRPEDIGAALQRSKETIKDMIAARTFTEAGAQLLYDLWEHEILHQGQLIRYFYANGLAFPAAFAKRYALAQPDAQAAQA